MHNFLLLPDPGRPLACAANQSFYSDSVSPTIRTAPSGVYWIPLSATATLVGEGENRRGRMFIRRMPKSSRPTRRRIRFEQKVTWLESYHRPIICTEFMARPAGSTFDTILPIAKSIT